MGESENKTISNVQHFLDERAQRSKETAKDALSAGLAGYFAEAFREISPDIVDYLDTLPTTRPRVLDGHRQVELGLNDLETFETVVYLSPGQLTLDNFLAQQRPKKEMKARKSILAQRQIEVSHALLEDNSRNWTQLVKIVYAAQLSGITDEEKSILIKHNAGTIFEARNAAVRALRAKGLSLDDPSTEKIARWALENGLGVDDIIGILEKRISKKELIERGVKPFGQADLPRSRQGDGDKSSSRSRRRKEPSDDEKDFLSGLSRDWKDRPRLTRSQGKLYASVRGMRYGDEMNMLAFLSPEGMSLKGSPTKISRLVKIDGEFLRPEEVNGFRVRVIMTRRSLIKLLEAYGTESPLALREYVDSSGKTPGKLLEELRRQAKAARDTAKTTLAQTGHPFTSQTSQHLVTALVEEETAPSPSISVEEAETSTEEAVSQAAIPLVDSLPVATVVAEEVDQKEPAVPEHPIFEAEPSTETEYIEQAITTTDAKKAAPRAEEEPDSEDDEEERTTKRRAKSSGGQLPEVPSTSLARAASSDNWRHPASGQTRISLFVNGRTSEQDAVEKEAIAREQRRAFAQRVELLIELIGQQEYAGQAIRGLTEKLYRVELGNTPPSKRAEKISQLGINLDRFLRLARRELLRIQEHGIQVSNEEFQEKALRLGFDDPDKLSEALSKISAMILPGTQTIADKAVAEVAARIRERESRGGESATTAVRSDVRDLRATSGR